MEFIADKYSVEIWTYWINQLTDLIINNLKY